jgi:hypothetical protein
MPEPTLEMMDRHSPGEQCHSAQPIQLASGHQIPCRLQITPPHPHGARSRTPSADSNRWPRTGRSCSRQRSPTGLREVPRPPRTAWKQARQRRWPSNVPSATKLLRHEQRQEHAANMDQAFDRAPVSHCFGKRHRVRCATFDVRSVAPALTLVSNRGRKIAHFLGRRGEPALWQYRLDRGDDLVRQRCVCGRRRAITSPVGETRNFSKFHWMSPACP